MILFNFLPKYILGNLGCLKFGANCLFLNIFCQYLAPWMEDYRIKSAQLNFQNKVYRLGEFGRSGFVYLAKFYFRRRVCRRH